MVGIVNNNRMKYFGLTLIAVILFVFDILLGSTSVSLREILNLFNGSGDNSMVSTIIFDYRIPKAITALISGIALSICGLQMQTLFKNPLADPYIMGISSGAGLGVALFLMGSSIFGASVISSLGMSIGITLSAWIGAFCVTLLIILLSKKLRDNLSLLIFGVMIGYIGSAIVGLLQYFSSSAALKSYVVWSMGSFAGLSQSQLLILALFLIAGTLISIYNIKDLNLLLLGEQYAENMGINLRASKLRILISTTLLAGGVTAFCGPIGFIGIAVPHIARAVFKNADHRILMGGSALIGISTMLFADIIASLPGQSGVLPINTVSSLFGIPVILIIIIKKRMI